jgi:hypothetical protein
VRAISHGHLFSDGFFALTGGTRYVIAFGDGFDSDDSVETVAMSPAPPRHVRTLVPSAGGQTACGEPRAGIVACAVTPDRGRPEVQVLSIIGKRSAETTHDCAITAYGDSPAVLGDSAAWITESDCKDGAGQLQVLGFNGKVKSSIGTFAVVQPIPAFGEIVLENRAGTRLELLSGAQAKPRTLVDSAT